MIICNKMSVFQQLLNLQSLITIAACIFAVFVLFKWFLIQPISTKKSPPSPPKLPIIGNLHQLGLFPHCSLGALAQCYGPLMLLHLGKVPVLVVSSADAACEIVRNVIFANQPKLTPFVKLLNGFIDISMAPYEKYSDQGEVGSKFRKQFKDFIELMATFHVGDYIPWQGWLCYFNSLNAKLKKTSKEVDDFLEVLVNLKMAENVDEGNENDFKENDNDRIKLGKFFKNLSEEEKAKFRMVGSDIARNKDKEDDFVKGIQKAMETRCAPDGGVDIDVDLGIDDIDKLRNEYCDDKGYIKLKTLESKLVNQRELFYMHSISFARKFIDKSLSPITTWTNRDVTNLLSFVKKNGGYGSSKMQQMQQVMETLKENLTQKQVEQQKENNGAAVGITSPSRKQQKNDESSHEILTFAELMKRANERPDEDDILEKKLLDEENVEEKHDERILTGESDLNEGKRKQIFYNATI
ncbi:cytochrome P450 71A22 [Citrus sinensis]|nr:cytochrome P450 71A22 [Citrus sinensis]